MSLSRWKMMAGVLGVSLGGLAAMAGQCPKNEPMKGNPPPMEIPVASAPAAAPMIPPPAPSLPPLPSAEPTRPSSAPPVLPVIPASGTVPVPPPADPLIPVTPTAPSSLPVTPPVTGSADKPSPASGMPQPALEAPSTSVAPPAIPPMHDLAPDLPYPVANVVSKPATGAPTAVSPAVAVAKYRILLRVGEGEPVFEVRSGDALMLKVVCEKVDVKSPEKGAGPSSVKACGKVRFAGFGAEGTCDELNFLAGTGEVAMTGNVKIQVKDKLGRVESELSAELMKYKIDPHTVAGQGQLKP